MYLKLFCIFFLLPVLASAQGIVKTIAGNGTHGYGGDGIAATQTSLTKYPEKLVVGANGHLYFADSTRIRKIDAVTGIVTTIAGGQTSGYSGDGGPAINAQFSRISYLAFSPDGDLYLTDLNNDRVRKINMQTGIVTTIAGTGQPGYSGDGGQALNAKLSLPYAIAFDRDSNLLIADIGNSRLRKVDHSGIINTIAGNGDQTSSGDGGLAINAGMPYGGGLCVDTANNIYIECFYQNRIRKIEAATGIITTYAGTGNAPSNGDGGLATSANVVGTSDLTIDEFGNIYIVENGPHKIRKVDAVTGIISTVAGTGTSGYNGENISADTAMLSEPLKITVDSCGSLYISDAANYRIRKVIYDPNCLPLNVKETTGINSFAVYPNPASTELTIKSGDKISSLSLVDITGRVVFQRKVNSERTTVDVNGLASGIYFVKVWFGSNRHESKVLTFVKE